MTQPLCSTTFHPFSEGTRYFCHQSDESPHSVSDNLMNWLHLHLHDTKALDQPRRTCLNVAFQIWILGTKLQHSQERKPEIQLLQRITQITESGGSVQPPSLAPGLWVFLPSVLSSVTEKLLCWGRSSDEAIFHFSALRNSWVAFRACFGSLPICTVKHHPEQWAESYTLHN